MNSYNYIIVDDEQLIRRGIRNKIDSFAEELKLHCAGEASNGREAIALIKACDPHIIVTDMRMPGVDGKVLLSLLKQQYADKKIIVISGYKDYEYMQGAIEAQVTGYLLKPFSREEVRSVMEKAITAIDHIVQSRILREQMEGMQAEQERLYEQADLELIRALIESGRPGANVAAGFQSNKGRMLQQIKPYKLVLLYWPELLLSPSRNYQQIVEQFDKQLTEKLAAIPASMIPATASPFIVIPASTAPQLYLLIPHEHVDKSERGSVVDTVIGTLITDKVVETLVDRIAIEGRYVAKIDRHVDSTAAGASSWLIGVSSPKNALDLLHEAYSECRSAMDASPADRRGTGLSSYYNYSELLSKKEAAVINQQPWTELDKLVYLLESGSVSIAVDHLQEVLFHSGEKQKSRMGDGEHPISQQEYASLTWSQVKQRCYELIAAIQRSAKQGLLLLPPGWGQVAEAVLVVQYDQAAVTAYMEQLLTAVSIPVREHPTDSTQSLVHNIKSYIEHHYQEDLTLKKLSDRFFVNASYCSHIFKEKTGMNITEFILANRIAKAKELLHRTDYAMDRIAKQVGYSNEKYFFRIFKKATECTPQEYRRACRQDSAQK